MATLTQIDRCVAASGPIRNFGSPAALDDLGAQTIIVCVKLTGAPQNNVGYLYSKCATNGDGVRLFIFNSGGSYSLRFGYKSTGDGTNQYPLRNSSNGQISLSDGWAYYVATWDGTQTATGIKLYKMLESSGVISELSYSTTSNGTGSLISDASYNVTLWNRDGGNRGIAGDGAWVAVLDGVLNSTEIKDAIDNGPLSDARLVALFANADEIANSGISQTSSSGITVITDSAQFPANTNLGDVPGITITAAPGEASGDALPVSLSITGTVSVSPAPAEATGEALPVSLTVSSAISIAALPAEASGEALPVSLTIAGTVSATPAPAEATGDALPVNLVVSGGVSVAALPAEATGEALPVSLSVVSAAITLHADHDRASVNLSGSSVSGTGDSAIISIKPKLQESESIGGQSKWLKPHARVSGVNGFRPTFRFLDYVNAAGGMHGYPWAATRRPMFSYDGESWQYFDTCTPNAGSQYVEFRHNTAFTQDVVYVCWNRALSPIRFAEWVEAWQLSHPTRVYPSPAAIAHAPTPAVASWPGQMFIADEYSPQTDSLGNAIPTTPLYSFEIRDDSTPSPLGEKGLLIFQLMNHAGEDQSLFYIKAMIEYLLAGAGDAPALLQYFDFEFHTLNMPGWYGGGWRGSWTQGVSGYDDANKHAWESGTGLEIVDKVVAVMDAVRAGRTVVGFVDMHGAYSDPLFIYNWAGSDDEDFVSAYNSFGGPTLVGGLFTEVSQSFGARARTNLGTNDSFTFETGDPTPQNNATVTSAGQILARTWNKLRIDGLLDMPEAVISLTPAAAEATGDALPVSLTVTARANAGVAEATGEAMPVSLLVDIAPRPAAAEAVGDALPVSLSIVEYVDFIIASASANGEAVPVSLRITGASWTPVSGTEESWDSTHDAVETWADAV